jgi:hypothetical protein
MAPSTIFLIAANLLPLAGVFFWGWDVFVLLMLYWLETLVIAVWAIVKMLLPPDDPSSGQGKTAGFGERAMLAGFTIVHAGIFMAVHFVFLWVLFAGPWLGRIATFGDFWDQLVIGRELWAPLLFLFLVRGWQVFGLRIRRRLGLVPADAIEPQETGVPGGLYLRIILMQLTIIFGGWVAMILGGNVGALVLLVLLKILVELHFDRAAGRTAAGRSAGAAARPPT